MCVLFMDIDKTHFKAFQFKETLFSLIFLRGIEYI